MIKIKKRYKDYTDKILETLIYINGSNDAADEYIPTLDLLAINYDILFRAVEDVKLNGVSNKTDARAIKNPSLQAIYSSQNIINQLIKNFPTNPMSKAKINKLNESDSDDAEAFIETLSNL